VLAAVGSLGALAGCSGRRPTADPPTTTTGAPLGTELAVDGRELTVTRAVVRDAGYTRPFPDELGVSGAGGGRFVFVAVSSAGSGPDPGDVVLVTDGDDGPNRRTGWPPDEISEAFYAVTETYVPEVDGEWVAFRVPAPLDTDTLAVAVGDRTWRLPDRLRRRLADPKPAYELERFAPPETVAAGTRLDVAATVRNTTDVAGTFRGVMVAVGAGIPCCISRTLGREVPPDETAMVSASFGRVDATAGGDTVDLRLKWPGGRREAVVTVE
jgi:hypothetical protein